MALYLSFHLFRSELLTIPFRIFLNLILTDKIRNFQALDALNL